VSEYLSFEIRWNGLLLSMKLANLIYKKSHDFLIRIVI
jgi:hypothetical protein